MSQCTPSTTIKKCVKKKKKLAKSYPCNILELAFLLKKVYLSCVFSYSNVIQGYDCFSFSSCLDFCVEAI
jgi:hypothetical protein